MAGDDPEVVRQRGNELYQQGRYRDAIARYHEALELSPEDAAPLSNLSAAYMEVGDFTSAIESADKALALVQDDSKKPKVLVRKARSQLYSLDIEGARKTIALLEGGKDKMELLKIVASGEQSTTSLSISQLRKAVILDIPRYKPEIDPSYDYWPFGTDVPTSLHDQQLSESTCDTIAMMFGGVGDGRHLFATLAAIQADETLPPSHTKQPAYHFTAVDVSSAALARLTVLLLLLDDLSASLQSGDNKTKDDLIECFTYTYLAPVMPSAMYTILRKVIQKAIGALEGKTSLPSFLDLPPAFRAALSKLLKEWRYEVQTAHSPAKLRPRVLKAMQSLPKEQYPLNHEGCAKEQEFYQSSGVLLAKSVDSEFDSYSHEVKMLFGTYAGKKLGQVRTIDAGLFSAVDDSWRTNVTVIHLAHEDAKRPNMLTGEKDCATLTKDPFTLSFHLRQQGFTDHNRRGLLSHTSAWLSTISKFLVSLQGRLKIELCLGDVHSVSEQIKYGILEHRQYRSSSQQATDCVAELADRLGPISLSKSARHQEAYPVVYDRVHLANVPDMTAGSLTTLLYELPLIRGNGSSFMTFACLVAPDAFRSYAHYNIEYIGLCEPLDIAKVFQVVFEDEPIVAKPGGNPMMDELVAMMEYRKWTSKPASLCFEELMPRLQLKEWLLRVFLKVVIPMHRAYAVGQSRKLPKFGPLVFSPINMTTFLRLCNHLNSIGYPAHWLSEVVHEICAGSITTTVRPPRSLPLAVEETKKVLPALQQCTKPFVAELQMLLAIWKPILGFGVLQPTAPLSRIKQYTAKLQIFDELWHSWEPAFALAFYEANILCDLHDDDPSSSDSLRKILLDDEMATKSPHAKRVRDNLHIVTTWEWDPEMRTATFWLDEQFRNSLRRPDWYMDIWRTDSWQFACNAFALPYMKETGLTWADRAASYE